jgi:hypothetical protein
MAIGEITDIGPIPTLRFPIPEEGGVVLFKGPNGSGKSTALGAVDAAMGSGKKLQPRDRTTAGHFDGMGISLTVGQTMRRKGELEVVALDSKLPVSALVDPGSKDPLAADAVSIKALLQLVGIEPDPSIFYELFDGQSAFERLCPVKPNEDIVSLAARAKRVLEEEARRAEGQADTEDGHAAACKESASTVDTTVESDVDTLQSAHSLAIQAETRLRSQADEATRNAETVRKAREKIALAQSQYTGLSAVDANNAKERAAEAEREAMAVVESARLALKAAEKHHEEKRNSLAAAIVASKAADHHFELIEQWSEQVETQINAAPSEAELVAAAEAVKETREAIEAGAVVRRAKDSLAKARQHLDEATKHRQRGQGYRDSAKGIDELLSSLVSKTGSGLRVKDGRLVIDTPKRGETFFRELSMGERYRIATDITADAVGSNGAFTIPQEAWEGLDPMNRQAVDARAKERGVLIFTAEADGGELRAEVYGE